MNDAAAAAAAREDALGERKRGCEPEEEKEKGLGWWREEVKAAEIDRAVGRSERECSAAVAR